MTEDCIIFLIDLNLPRELLKKCVRGQLELSGS